MVDIPIARRGLPHKQRTVQGLDGRHYTPEVEDEINVLAARVLGTHDGQRFTAYLRNITLNVALESDVTPHALMHMEGQRWLVGLMLKRAQAGAHR
jgi:hypothetical protein